jgi:hypothetical protein
LEQSVVEDAIVALASRQLRLSAATTTVAALARRRTGAWCLVDGSDALVIESDRGRLRSVRRADSFAAPILRDGFDEARDAARCTNGPFTWRPRDIASAQRPSSAPMCSAPTFTSQTAL